MRWPMILGYGILREEAGNEGSNEGSGDSKDPKTIDKIKIGGKEFKSADVESAMSLMSALQDPETGLEIIETLAKRAGILDKKGEPEGTRKETQKTIEGKVTKLFKAKLGKDFDKFSDQIGPLLDEAVQDYLNEHFEKSEQVSSAKSWESQVDKFTENHTLTEDIEDKMKELMEEAPPNVKSKTFDPQKYLSRMYKNALEELDIEPPAPEKRVKARKTRTTENEDEVPDFVVRPKPKALSLDDAIDAALKGIRYK